MIRELDVIALAEDLPAHGLVSGDVGTVVLVHGDAGFEVEFLNFSGDTVAVVSVAAGQVRALGPNEIHHARRLGTAS
jgi:hypothetical protein